MARALLTSLDWQNRPHAYMIELPDGKVDTIEHQGVSYRYRFDLDADGHYHVYFAVKSRV